MTQNNRTHLVTQPGDERGARASNKVLPGRITLTLGACLLVGAAVWAIHQTSRSAALSAQLIAENESLRSYILETDARMSQLDEVMRLSEAREQEARLLAGLDPLDAETRRLGVGGPLVGAESTWTPDDPGFDRLVGSQVQLLDELERRVEFQHQSYTETLLALEERKDLLDRTPTISPLRGLHAVSSGFGWRDDPFTGERAFHRGVDLRAPAGTPVFASAAGQVIDVARRADYGISVTIEHGAGVETKYAHLAGTDCEVGQWTERGEIIGTLGSTGRSTGPHVHYEVRVNGITQDPVDYIIVHPDPPTD